jgi:signal transduction histidine kinase
MKKQSVILFYILGIYVILQFSWWGYHLIELTGELKKGADETSKRVVMIIGEGLVFFVILLFGLWRVRAAIQKELRLTQRQNNFLLSVTHELKTPLTANKLYLQTLLKRQLDAAKSQELTEKAIQENERLEKMIDNILNASRLENNALLPIKTVVQLSELLHKLGDDFQKTLEKQQLATNISPAITANMDPFFIETIVHNLLENAAKYAGEEAKIQLYLRNEGEFAILGVSDNGPGITKEEQKRIFQKFYRQGNEETRSQKGTGLGLFIATELARLHGWKLQYRSSPLGGADFQLIWKR